jgi:hypothetical protein
VLNKEMEMVFPRLSRTALGEIRSMAMVRLTKEGKMDSDNKLFELRELCLDKVFVAGVINWMQRMRSMGDKRMAWSKT